jgi:ParB family transcriptional regulator, chromosome partitioning protein
LPIVIFMSHGGLGRGLSSLIPQKIDRSRAVIKEDEYVASSPSNPSLGGVLEVSPELIDANPKQPRREFDQGDLADLSESIKNYGIIQPLVVTKQGDRYELIAGERRLRASKMAGLKKVPIVVRDYDEQRKLEVAIIENVQRADLNPIEKAMAYRQLMDEFSLTVEEVAKRVGKSRPQVSNTMRLTSLPEEIRSALSKGQLSEAHAVYLMGLDNPVKQMEVFRKIVQNNWTVRETSQQVRKLGGTKESRIKTDQRDAAREAAFRSFFAAKAEVKRESRGGKVVISFSSDDELDEMIRKIKN